MLAAGVLTPRRTPGWPLAVTLGVHLLFGWWWLHATSVRMLPSNKGALREFVVVTVRPLPAPASPSILSSRSVGLRSSLHSGQMQRTRRWAMTAWTAEATR